MNNQFRIKNSRNEQATVWSIGNNTYFCSIKWDDEASTMTASKSAVDSLVEYGEWTIVQEDKLPNKFKFVTDVCEDHDGNVYTCSMPEDVNGRAIITWKGSDGYVQDTTYGFSAVQRLVKGGKWKIIEEDSLPDTFKFTYQDNDTIFTASPCKTDQDCFQIDWESNIDGFGTQCSKDAAKKFVDGGAWKIVVGDEDEQEPDLMNYLYEIIRSGKDDEDNKNSKEFVPTSFKYRHVDYPEQIGTFTATSPTTGIVTYDNQEGPCTYWDSKQAENFVQRGVWRVIPPSEYVEDFDEALDNADIIRLISDFTASSDHYFVIEKGQLNVYHGDNSIPYTCENEDDIVTVMNAIETLDNYMGDKH